MNDLIPFDFKGTSVRVLTDSEGAAHFVAADVCAVLTIANSRDALARLDDDEKGVGTADTPGGPQEMATITEAGVYTLAMTSRKPEAKPFVRWLSHEVVPSIRKRGGYLTPEATEKALTDPDFIIRLATSLKEERERTAALSAVVRENAPKVLFADAVATSHTSILVGDLAKLLRQNGIPVGQNRLFQWLRDHGFLLSRGTAWNMPSQRAQEAGLFEVKEATVQQPDGTVRVTKTTKVTGKGQTYFVARFLDGRFSVGDEEVLPR